MCKNPTPVVAGSNGHTYTSFDDEDSVFSCSGGDQLRALAAQESLLGLIVGTAVLYVKRELAASHILMIGVAKRERFI